MLLPFTLNENRYGKKLFSTFSSLKLKTRIFSTTACKFNSNKREYTNDNHKIVVSDISENKTKKEIYDINNNVLLATVFDTIIDDNTFERTIDNVSLVISNNDKVLQRIIKFNFEKIKSKLFFKNKNKNYATLYYKYLYSVSWV